MKERDGRFFRKAFDLVVELKPEGLFLGGIRVVSRKGGHFEPSVASDAYGLGQPKFKQRFERIAKLLDDGRSAEAIFLANFSHENVKFVEAPLCKANFNPFEPRNAHGEWSQGGALASSPLLDNIGYRGYFHDFVLQDLLNGLTKKGSIAISQIPVTGINGATAVADGLSLPSGWKTPYFIELKTGFDPDFTEQQKQVYPLICIGGHTVSFDPRIRQLGLTPGQLLPPLDIMLVHTYGPGLPLRFDSYCEEFVFGGGSNAH